MCSEVLVMLRLVCVLWCHHEVEESEEKQVTVDLSGRLHDETWWLVRIVRKQPAFLPVRLTSLTTLCGGIISTFWIARLEPTAACSQSCTIVWNKVSLCVLVYLKQLVLLRPHSTFRSEWWEPGWLARHPLRQLQQPGSASRHTRSDDALLRLQESFQARWADLKGRRAPAWTRGCGLVAWSPPVTVSAGRDEVVLGHFLCTAGRKWWVRGGALARCPHRSFQGADGCHVEPFEVGGGVRGRVGRFHIWGAERLQGRRRRGGEGGAAAMLQRKQEEQTS